MQQMDSKTIVLNRIFYVVVFLLLLSAIAAAYMRVVVAKDYQIVADVSCDPVTEKCFSWTCDPATDDTCSQNPDERVSYYKVISKNAGVIARCEATEGKEGCGEELSCLPGEKSCSYRYCDPSTALEDETCAAQQ